MVTSRGTEINERYRLEEPVGRGGMATVWRARDLRLGRDVAIKVIAETRLEETGFIERFEREARISARLSHPNLVSVHDLGFHEGRPYLVMEFIDGETLSRRLERAPETVDEVELARTLLGVLVAIHDEGIVHRDIKPANVLFEDGGRIRLTDFGIARIVGSSSITETHEVIGTLKYMAPEVRDGEPPSPEADLYALGVLLAECGATDGPLRDLVRKLRSPDVSQRPSSARLALISMAGVESASGGRETAQRAPTEVLRERPRSARPPEPVATGPAAEARSVADPEPAPAVRTGHRPARRVLGFAAGFAAVIAAVAIALTLLGGDGGGGSSEQASSGSQEQPSGNGDNGREGSAAAGDAEEPEPEPAETATIDPARGVALDAKGLDLIEAGNPEQAVPILRRAVASWPEDSTDLNYAYALYNLGVALRQSGRPDEAIPYLEQRLAWADQRETVKAELAAAKAAAG